MKNLVKSLTVGLMTTVFMSTMANAQESNFVTASVGADLVSSYIWRGSDCGGFSVQPGITLETKNGFSVGAWGSVGLDKEDTKEFDLFLGYAVASILHLYRSCRSLYCRQSRYGFGGRWDSC